MPIKISYTLSDSDYQSLKKQYEKNKSKLGDVTLEEFINKSIDIAIRSHIQFSNMNEHMIDLFSDFGLPSINDLNKAAKDDLSKLDDLVNKFFQDNIKVKNKKDTRSNDQKTNVDKKDNDKKLN